MAAKSEPSNEVFFISTPAIGMLTPTVEFARRLVNHRNGLSATVLLIPVPHWPTVHSYTLSLPATASPNLQFHLLPAVDPPSPDRFQTLVAHLSTLVDNYKPQVRRAISETKRHVAGLFADMFCTTMIDVAEELGVDSYLFFASPAGFLSLLLDLPGDLGSRLASGETELAVQGLGDSVPKTVFPTTVLKRGDGYSWFLRHAERYTSTKGIVVNTLREVEGSVLDALVRPGGPRIFPLGPILDLAGPARWHPDRAEHERVVMGWLDGQPEASVVFLCFGSMGNGFSEAQAEEIGAGLGRAGVRFLWSRRDVELASPLAPDTKSGTGIVCGWVPQVSVLGHQAVGGFVSHCGWNSVLESLWHGVPVATWPIYAEQQLNAFELVRVLGLAVEITLDHRDGGDLIAAERVEEGVKRLMGEEGDRVRAKVKAISVDLRLALVKDGSSYGSLVALAEELMRV